MTKIKDLSKVTMLHISPRKNRESILKKGLIVEQPASGYGVAPTQKALYFYHEDNINVVYDAIDTFGNFDVFEITGLKPSLAFPDEDSKATTWRESLKRFGTIAYRANVKPGNIKFLCNINNGED